MVDVDREEIRERKGVCGGCGAPLESVGDVQGEKRGEAFACTRETCEYTEWRMFGDTYYETLEE